MALEIAPWSVLLHLYLFMPAAIANMAPVLCKSVIPWFATPLDFDARFRGKRIFGDHKTFRGLLIGVVTAVLVSYAQSRGPADLLLVPSESWLLVGLLLGFGALLGDLIKSFFKRQIGIKSGSDWFVFDQIDFGIGALVFLSPIYWPGLLMAIVILVVLLLGHIIIKRIGTAIDIQ